MPVKSGLCNTYISVNKSKRYIFKLPMFSLLLVTHLQSFKQLASLTHRSIKCVDQQPSSLFMPTSAGQLSETVFKLMVDGQFSGDLQGH